MADYDQCRSFENSNPVNVFVFICHDAPIDIVGDIWF